ncbi:hypothetical protein [Rhizosaccharibacter radicis]|uniref:RES domain-containing protein n=1 Tax=Rhizosaccharibacter radicis TaxID=2782605 RepID=A0ABT1W0H9_9PROT|nr:hypothetical protein [Acetobacteraceae bacterium KSS12]
MAALPTTTAAAAQGTPEAAPIEAPSAAAVTSPKATASPARAAPGPASHGLQASLRHPAAFLAFEQASPSLLAERLRQAPVPGPDASPHETVRDARTGADIDRFGSAYSYPNPLNDTTNGRGGVSYAASRSADLPMPAGAGFVVARWGYPPKPMPRVPGDDLDAAPPPLPLVRYAVQASAADRLDDQALRVLQLAVQAQGRVLLSEITVEQPSGHPHCCDRFPRLVLAELARQGVDPRLVGWSDRSLAELVRVSAGGPSTSQASGVAPAGVARLASVPATPRGEGHRFLVSVETTPTGRDPGGPVGPAPAPVAGG